MQMPQSAIGQQATDQIQPGQKRIDSSDQDENASYEEIDENDLKSMESVDPGVALQPSGSKPKKQSIHQQKMSGAGQVANQDEDDEQYSEIED